MEMKFAKYKWQFEYKWISIKISWTAFEYLIQNVCKMGLITICRIIISFKDIFVELGNFYADLRFQSRFPKSRIFLFIDNKFHKKYVFSITIICTIIISSK